MKYKQIVPSTAPITTIVVEGQPRHYFHSKALGKCRAIIISTEQGFAKKAENPQKEQDFEE